MISGNLKKLVFRKELALIEDWINAVDASITVQSAEGMILHGQTVHTSTHRYPIQIEEQILGWVNGPETAATVAAMLAHLASRELEKRMLARELLGKYKEISLLFNISEKISDSLDVQEVAFWVLDEARRMLNSSSGALFLLRDGTPFVDPVATFGDESLTKEPLQLGEGILGHIIQMGRGEIVNDVFSDPRHLIGKGRISSLLCVPLKHKEKVLGAIALNRAHNQAYTAEDLKLLTTLACQATGVISALMHERKLKESRQNDLIFRLSSQIRDSLELRVILETAVSEIYSVLTLDRCLFLWYHPDHTLPKHATDIFLACSRLLQLAKGGLNIVTEVKQAHLSSLIGSYSTETIGGLGRQFLLKEIVRVNDVRSIADPDVHDFLKSHDFAALLAMPMQTCSGQIGVICCGTREARSWGDDEVELMQAVTNQLAIALDQAELYEQSRTAAQLAQEKAKELESALQELQHTQMQLIQSEKMSSLGQMVAGIAHEINNPVNFIHGNLNYIEDYATDILNLLQQYQTECTTPSDSLQEAMADMDLEFLLTDMPKLLTSMRVGTNRIREIVLSLRNFSRLDEAAYKVANIHEGIDSTLLILESRLKPKKHLPGIRVVKHYGDVPPVQCYPGQLNQVLMNILANAIDALEEKFPSLRTPIAQSQPSCDTSQPAHLPTLTIATTVSPDNHLVIQIADNGPGIPESVQSKLFDPFFTTKAIGRGTGLGLSISYQIIVERHQGRMECHSTLGQGTEFVLKIPIQQMSALRQSRGHTNHEQCVK